MDTIIDDDTNLNFVENKLKTKYWSRNETFYFVNHKSKDGGSFPCLTTPGKELIIKKD